MSIKQLKIASRGSRLALAQAHYTADLIRQIDSRIDVTIETISTKGDRDKSDFLYKSESTMGFFTSEVENALIDRRADIAVHSMKDLPTAGHDGLIVAATPKRQSTQDALITSHKIQSIDDLPQGTTIGTSSLRRIAQLKHYRSDLNCVPLRGNVETRVGKVDSGELEAIVIACAGLNRLDMSDKISAILPENIFITAPAQGALAIQCRTQDADVRQLLASLNDPDSEITARTERLVLAATHGGCSIPLGVNAKVNNGTITIRAMISDVTGVNYIEKTAQGPVQNAETLAADLAKELLAAGGAKILDEIRSEKS